MEKNKEIDIVATDYWKAYMEFIPEEKHIQSKEETYIVEGYNSIFLYFLARLKRKTKTIIIFMISKEKKLYNNLEEYQREIK